MKLISSIVFSMVLLFGVGALAQQAHAQVVAGCTTTNGYNTTTGVSCNGVTTLPVGCSSVAGFSSANGLPCNSNSAALNGYTNSIVGVNGYLNGCTSIAGYSATTGYACNMTIPGITTGGIVNTVPVVINPGTVTSPGLPTTGAGDKAPVNIAVLLASGLIAFFGIRYSIRTAHATT